MSPRSTIVFAGCLSLVLALLVWVGYRGMRWRSEPRTLRGRVPVKRLKRRRSPSPSRTAVARQKTKTRGVASAPPRQGAAMRSMNAPPSAPSSSSVPPPPPPSEAPSAFKLPTVKGWTTFQKFLRLKNEMSVYDDLLVRVTVPPEDGIDHRS